MKKSKPEPSEYFIVNLSHLHREHLYVTFWRPENKGYAFPLSWAGRYAREAVLAELGYYNTGYDIAVPCEVVEALGIPPAPGQIDNDAGPVVLSNRKNWKKLLASSIRRPAMPHVPVYPGARGKMRMAYEAAPA